MWMLVVGRTFDGVSPTHALPIPFNPNFSKSGSSPSLSSTKIGFFSSYPLSFAQRAFDSQLPLARSQPSDTFLRPLSSPLYLWGKILQKLLEMCPLRLILVFLSASLAGYFAWKSIRSDSPKPQDDVSEEKEKVLADSEKEIGFGKVIGKGFWTFVDMASGRYLWRNLKVGSQEGEKMKGS